MPDAVPFDELGKIIAAGGDFALARALAFDWTPDQLNEFRFFRFPGLNDDLWGQLLAKAGEVRKAAEQLTDLAMSEQSRLDAIPINPDLFGPEPEGRRYRAWFEAINDEGQSVWRGKIDIADLSKIDELFSEIEKQLEQNTAQYQTAWIRSGGGKLSETKIVITAISRSF